MLSAELVHCHAWEDMAEVVASEKTWNHQGMSNASPLSQGQQKQSQDALKNYTKMKEYNLQQFMILKKSKNLFHMQ